MALFTGLRSGLSSGAATGLGYPGENQAPGASVRATATLAALPQARSFAGAAAVDGLATVVGGGTLVLGGSAAVNAVATVAADGTAGGATSVQELYDSADPAQAIIDLMSYATKPDYLWLGNVADGAWVDVESSLSMAKFNTPTFEEAVTAFGGADSVRLDAAGDGFEDTVNDGSLDIGTGDYQILAIIKPNSHSATRSFISKYSTTGYRQYATSSGHYVHNVAGTSGAATVSVAVDHGTTNAQTMLFAKNSSATTIATREGTGSSAASIGDADAGSSEHFAFGFAAIAAQDVNIAMVAVWIGTGDLTDTERTALAEGLGLE